VTPFVPLRDESDLDGDAAAAYRTAADDRGGTLPNVFKLMANSGPALAAVSEVGTLFRRDSVLSRELCEAVIVTVADEVRCTYEWTHHVSSARRLGLEPAAVLALAGSPPDPARDDDLAVAVRIARVLARGDQPGADAKRDAVARFGARGFVELGLLVGYYVMLSRFIEFVDVPLESDHPAVPFVD
jgi:4-carboxymuconolactone decarboxylase